VWKFLKEKRAREVIGENVKGARDMRGHQSDVRIETIQVQDAHEVLTGV
jgi:hypothetical protein